MKKRTFAMFFISAMVLLTISVSAFAVSGPYTVYASVVSGTGAIQAVLQPGEFTVPSGSTAVITKFQHDNPATGYHNEKLGKNVYSVTQGIYMVDGNGNALMQLPAGKYRFAVGGSVGASGMLVYELHP
ncbi:MAG: hypothetical protein Q7I97_06280 [Thermovirgaceae bacterium]|nr:hypothetical protein [Thermovirgaceae bacterium]